MTGSSGIGRPSSTPEEVPGIGPISGASGENVEAAMHTPVATTTQLKAVLIKNLGEHDGTKLYNSFMQSFAMLMLQQVQHSAQQAQKAAQNMRMNT